MNKDILGNQFSTESTSNKRLEECRKYFINKARKLRLPLETGIIEYTDFSNWELSLVRAYEVRGRDDRTMKWEIAFEPLRLECVDTERYEISDRFKNLKSLLKKKKVSSQIDEFCRLYSNIPLPSKIYLSGGMTIFFEGTDIKSRVVSYDADYRSDCMPKPIFIDQVSLNWGEHEDEEINLMYKDRIFASKFFLRELANFGVSCEDMANLNTAAFYKWDRNRNLRNFQRKIKLKDIIDMGYRYLVESE